MTTYTLTEGQDLTLNGARETAGDVVINAVGGGHDVDINGGGQTDSIVYNGGDGVDDVTANGTPSTVITIDTGAGNDIVNINGNATSLIIGGADNDLMSGSAGAETYVFSFSGFKYALEETTTTRTETVSFNNDPSAKADWRAWENYEARLDAFKASLHDNGDGTFTDTDGVIWKLDGPGGTVLLSGKQTSNLSGASVGDDGKFVYADNVVSGTVKTGLTLAYEYQDYTGTKTITDTVTTEVKTLTGLDGQDEITDFHAEDAFEFRVGSQEAVDFFLAANGVGLTNFDKLFNVSDTEAGTLVSTDDGSWSLLLDNQHLELAQVYAKIDFVI